MPGGCGGDENWRERSGRVWLWREGEGDTYVAALGVVVVEGKKPSELGKQWHKAWGAHGLKAQWRGHGDDANPPSTIQSRSRHGRTMEGIFES
jgi:hypothetical protein